MAEAVSVDETEKKIEDFVSKIDSCERFNIVGVTEDNENFILSDSRYEKDTEDSCIQLSISEIVKVPLDSIFGAISGKRNDIVLNGYTRIVGYYSAFKNWNASKISEQADRVKGRKDGAYGFTGKGYNKEAFKQALVTLDNISTKNVAYA